MSVTVIGEAASLGPVLRTASCQPAVAPAWACGLVGVIDSARSAWARTGTGTGGGSVRVPAVPESMAAALVRVAVPAGRVTGVEAETSVVSTRSGALVPAASRPRPHTTDCPAAEQVQPLPV